MAEKPRGRNESILQQCYRSASFLMKTSTVRKSLLITVAIAFVVAGSWWYLAKAVITPLASAEKEYLPPGPIPQFTLVESHGRTITREDLKGKVWVASLMFTSCGNSCPILSANMSKLDRALGPRDDVRLVSITVTPEYDQPPVLRAYADKFHASDKWLFLTGQRSEIVHLANSGFWLSAGSEGTVTHSDKFVLLDREGNVRGFFDGMTSEGIEKTQQAVDQLAKATTK